MKRRKIWVARDLDSRRHLVTVSKTKMSIRMGENTFLPQKLWSETYTGMNENEIRLVFGIKLQPGEQKMFYITEKRGSKK